jgi:hypothetical protein
MRTVTLPCNQNQLPYSRLQCEQKAGDSADQRNQQAAGRGSLYWNGLELFAEGGATICGCKGVALFQEVLWITLMLLGFG